MGSLGNSYQYNNFQTKVDSNPIAPRVRRKRKWLLMRSASLCRVKQQLGDELFWA